MLQAFYSLHIFASERCWSIITRFSDIITNLASTLQFSDVRFVLMQILCDGKVPSNELMLHKTRRCTGARCKVHQNAADTERFCVNTMQPRDSNTKRPKYCTLICLAFWFWPFHSREGTIFSLYIYGFAQRDAYTQGCHHTHECFYTGQRDAFCKGIVLHTNLLVLHSDAFTRRSFYTQTRGHFYTQMPLHSDGFTPDCLYPLVHMLLHGDSFGTTYAAFTHRSFYTNTLTQRWFLHRSTFI